jgi:hypothetical protein
MKVSEFSERYPQYKIDFEKQLRLQPRVYDPWQLDTLPVELEADHPYREGSRGRPNLNQTLAHSQCATCHRVLRNDFFYTLPSMQKRNQIFPHCRECNQQRNAAQYEMRSDTVRARRKAIWEFLAPRCVSCGFDKHMAAMDIHGIDKTDVEILELITRATLTTHPGAIEALLREAANCVPLCSNCHRMLHAGALALPTERTHPRYRIADLLIKLNAIS